ncbi:unnamed protein product [Rotaria sp. Silwood2]|nr:unnamed protein product [Rotaria sp. Silwood2]
MRFNMVCSQLPNLRTCRLPFDFCPTQRYHLPEFSAPPLMTLPNLSSTVYLHTLTTGVNTIRFLERLVTCIPSIQNLSVGVQDSIVFDNDEFDLIPLPAAVDGFLLPRLSRLSMNCMDKRSFHRAVALLSSVFIQLTHLSLKLFACTSISGPLFISGDTIQKLCIDRLKTSVTYTLNLSVYVKNDLEKIIFNSFLKAPFTRRERPKVLIQKRDSWAIGDDCYYLVVYSLPYNDTRLPTCLFSRDLEKSCEIPINAVDLFPHANQLAITDFRNKYCLSDLGNCKSSISSLVPWSLLTKISITDCNVITAAKLQPILRMAYNVHTLRIYENRRISPSAVLRIYGNLGTRASEQIQSFGIHDGMLTSRKAKDVCMLLCNRFPNLKELSFTIYESWDFSTASPSYLADYKNESTKRIVNLIHFLVDHLQQLVSFHMNFIRSRSCETPCFPHLIRRQLHEWLLNRPYRLRCSTEEIQLWL